MDGFGQDWAVEAMESGIERATDDTEAAALASDREEYADEYEDEEDEDGD